LGIIGSSNEDMWLFNKHKNLWNELK
jgi:hypothetical protein